MTNAPRHSVHAVQFYETDEFLVESLAAYIGEGLAAGDAAVVIASLSHRAALDGRLKSRGLEIKAARASGGYVPIDGVEMLSRITVDGQPSATRFIDLVGGTIVRAGGEGGSRFVRVFGGMVGMLWADGQQDAAMVIEALWNDLARSMSFALVCGYSVASFPDAERPSAALRNIAAVHDQNKTRVG